MKSSMIIIWGREKACNLIGEIFVQAQASGFAPAPLASRSRGLHMDPLASSCYQNDLKMLDVNSFGFFILRFFSLEWIFISTTIKNTYKLDCMAATSETILYNIIQSCESCFPLTLSPWH